MRSSHCKVYTLGYKKNGRTNDYNLLNSNHNFNSNLYVMSEPTKHDDYMTNLSKVVGEACDLWLARRGFVKKGWKQQNDEFFVKNKKKKVS